MSGERGQSTVEWTGLMLLVALVFGAVAMAAHAVGDGGLPARLACAIAGRECAPERVFSSARTGSTAPAHTSGQRTQRDHRS